MIVENKELLSLERTSDGVFVRGSNGVFEVKTIADRKVEFVSFGSGRELALVKSAMGCPAYYSVHT